MNFKSRFFILYILQACQNALRIEDCISNVVMVSSLLFQVRENAPCVFLIKDVDRLCDASCPDYISNQFLTELDGIQSEAKILTIGATIDRTFLRPGRLFNLVYVPLLDTEMREKLFRSCFKYHVLEDDVDIEYSARMTHGMTGVKIAGHCNITIRLAMEESSGNQGWNTDNLVGFSF